MGTLLRNSGSSQQQALGQSHPEPWLVLKLQCGFQYPPDRTQAISSLRVAVMAGAGTR